jgi:hypothetical protein
MFTNNIDQSHSLRDVLSLKEDNDYINFERFNNDMDNPLFIMQNNNFTNLFQDNLFDKLEDNENQETHFEAQNHKIIKIDHYDSFSEDNKSLNKPNIETCSQTTNTISNSKNSNLLLNKKKGRPLQDNKAIVINESIIVTPDENHDLYMKERKKIQNRESQIRSRQKKKEDSNRYSDQIEELTKENERLKNENKNLTQDRNFLMEQIKFLQNLISNNMTNVNHSTDITSTSSKDKESLNTISTNLTKKVYFEAGSKSGLNKFFNIAFVCMLGILCLMINSEVEDGIGMNLGTGYSTKSETSINSSSYSYSLFTRILSSLLFVSSLVLMFIIYGKEYINTRKKLK